MKGKFDSDVYDRDHTLDQGEHSAASSSRDGPKLEFEAQKSKRKIPHIGNRLTVDHGRMSVHSGSSKLASYIRGPPASEADNFKVNDSYYFNQLAEKYVSRGESTDKVMEQMKMALDRKTSEIQGLRVHRDELKFISYTNPKDPIKISLALLKDKAKTEELVRVLKTVMKRDTKYMETEITDMEAYKKYLTSSKPAGEEDLVIDTQEQEQLMIDNLQKQNVHLFKELKELDKKHARELKNAQQSIALLRIEIKQKEDHIRDLKSKICFLHIKLHSRAGTNSRQKNMSLSIRKFITENNRAVEQAFIGNRSFKHYSKEINERISNTAELVKLQFFFQSPKELLTFKCIYKNSEGRLHEPPEQPDDHHHSPKKTKAMKSMEVRVKHLLSCKFYFKSKVVGLQCRVKTDRGTQNLQIGTCSRNVAIVIDSYNMNY